MPLPSGRMRAHSGFLQGSWFRRGPRELRGPNRLHGQLARAGAGLHQRRAPNAPRRRRPVSPSPPSPPPGDPLGLSLPPAWRLLPLIPRASNGLRDSPPLTEQELVLEMVGSRQDGGGSANAEVSALHRFELAVQRVLRATVPVPDAATLPGDGGLCQWAGGDGGGAGVAGPDVRLDPVPECEQGGGELPPVEDAEPAVDDRAENAGGLDAVAACVGAVPGLEHAGADLQRGRAHPGDGAPPGAAAPREAGGDHRERGQPGLQRHGGHHAVDGDGPSGPGLGDTGLQ